MKSKFLVLIFIAYNVEVQVAVPRLLVKIGNDVNFSWILKPKPYEEEVVTISNRLGDVFVFSNAEPTPFSQYDGRIINRGIAKAGIVNFTLLRTEEEDFGVYNASYHAGTYVGQELVLLVKPKTPFINPLIKPTLYGTLSLQCITSSMSLIQFGTIPMNYQWREQETSISNGSRYYLSGFKLDLVRLSISDIGKNITCSAYERMDMVSNKSDIYTVNIDHGPVNMLLSTLNTFFVMKKGYKLPNISCKADCNPRCTFQWYKKGQERYVNEQNLLAMGKLIVENSGLYFCRASNDYGKEDSNVISVEVYDMALEENLFCETNQTITFACKIETAIRKFDFLPWTHIKITSKTQLINGSIHSNINVLHIQRCNIFDSGKYICRASIPRLSSSSINRTAVLHVLAPPVIVQHTVDDMDGNGFIDVWYFCYPKPIIIKWLKDSELIYKINKSMLSIDNYNLTRIVFTSNIINGKHKASLSISNFSAGDSGIYTFSIFNSYGETTINVALRSKKEAKINVTIGEKESKRRRQLVSLFVFAIGISFVSLTTVITTSALGAILCRRMKRKKRNKIALQLIRKRLAEIAEIQNIKPSADSVDENEHYESIGDVSSSQSRESLDNRSEQGISDTTDEAQELSDDASEQSPQHRSYESLMQEKTQTSYRSLYEEDRNIEIQEKATSDTYSNMADDEISSSSET